MANGRTLHSVSPDPEAWFFLAFGLRLCVAAYGLVRKWRTATVAMYVLEAIVVLTAAAHTVIVVSIVTFLIGMLVIGLLASTGLRGRQVRVIGP